MTLHGNDGPLFKTLTVLIQNLHHVFADVAGPHIVEAQLNHTGEPRARLEKELVEVKVLREHDRLVFYSPVKNLRIRGVRRPQFAPVPGHVPMLAKILSPGGRKTVVDDHSHTGASSISRSLVSHAA
jgi:hypothetical protein